MFSSEEDKIGDKAWRAQQAHVHGPKEGRAHPLCGALDRTKAQTCPPSFRKLGLQGENLVYKEETCSTRRRLALQGKEAGPHYYKKAPTSYA